jgi:hypothetical protein
MHRHRAEAEAQDKAARLRVAQEQLAEWATEKQKDAATMVAQAQTLQGQLEAAAQGALSGDAAAALRAQVAALSQLLADNAAEAHAFAVQQKAQVDNLKRSLKQVGLKAVRCMQAFLQHCMHAHYKGTRTRMRYCRLAWGQRMTWT